jgi:hypothetical protein
VKDKDINIKVDPTFISAAPLIYKDGGVGSEDAFGEGTVKGRDDYYMKEFWRSFPPEIPGETPHLTAAPKEQSIFWRLLRPEFVRNYPIALNPDAGCLASQGAKDCDQHYEDLCLATRSVISVAFVYICICIYIYVCYICSFYIYVYVYTYIYI